MDKQMKENKAVLAAYLNMAQQNVVATLQHISKLMGVEVAVNDEEPLMKFYDRLKIWKDLKSHKKQADARSQNERTQKLVDLLLKHFPFLNAFKDEKTKVLVKDGKEPIVPCDEYSAVLRDAFLLLNTFRNECTHYSPVSRTEEQENEHQQGQRRAIRYLYQCLDGGRRVVKDRFSDTFEDEDFEFLTGYLRYGKPSKENIGGRDVKVFKEREDFLYRLKDNKGCFSYVGLLLFISLFLHKRYIMMMLDQSQIFKPCYLKRSKQEFTEEEKKIIRETFSIYRIRLPKERIESTRSDYALGLDMLSELQKCPEELYNVLSDDDRQTFHVKREDATADEDANEILLKRYDDRFPYFALRYIDECQVFSDIRFQVSLGKYRYKFYDKACIDTDEPDRLRTLQKEINGFGRLGEIEYERTKRWSDHIEYSDDKREPYITDQRAAYRFHNNRIGLLFNTAKRSVMSKSGDTLLYMPDLKFDTGLEGKDAHCEPPIAWLSVYELPGLIFHHLLCKKYGIDISLTGKIIKEWVELYTRLFDDIRKGELTPEDFIGKSVEDVISGRYHTTNVCLKEKDVPKKLVDYLTGETVDMESRFNTLAKKRMENELKKTQVQKDMFDAKRKLIGGKDNKFGKRNYEDIRPGTLANFLAKDLLKFQPCDDFNSNKVTGLNFQVLQASLAMYDGNLENLKSIFEKANLLAEGKQHPFLQNVLKQKPTSVLSFYEAYLKSKITYLEWLLKRPDELKKLLRYGNRKKWVKRDTAYYKELAGRYLGEQIGTAIELPTCLYEQSVKSILAEKLKREFGEKPRKMIEAAKAQRSNVAYLINCYFEWILQDKCQKFYRPTNKVFKRSYKYFNIINNEMDGKKLVPVYYSLDDMERLLAKDTSGKRQVDSEIAKYLNSKEAKEIAKRCADPDAPKRLLQNTYSDYKKSELAIRRYKVQDMLIFLMAKELLVVKNLEGTGIKADTWEKIKRYKLQNIMPKSENGNILSLPIPIKLTLTLKDGKEYTISQDEIKLKNYGDFFQFVYDERIPSLLQHVKNVEIRREDLEKELMTYDEKRVGIFKMTHEIEEAVISKYKAELNNPNSKFYFFETRDGRRIPVRNNFRAMMNRLKVDKTDIDDMADIRNAFSHNHYVKKMNLGEKDIPDIADAVSARYSKLVKKNKSKV